MVFQRICVKEGIFDNFRHYMPVFLICPTFSTSEIVLEGNLPKNIKCAVRHQLASESREIILLFRNCINFHKRLQTIRFFFQLYYKGYSFLGFLY